MITTICSNGREALDLIDQHYNTNKLQPNKRFDIILLDIQMPVMDGVSLLKAIKAGYCGIPPIIGLSANAMQGDAQKYISYGMDDYLSKPVSQSELFQKIDLWTNQLNAKAMKTKKEQEPESNYDKISLLDQETLDMLKEHSANNPELIKDIFDAFIPEANEIIEKLKQAYAGQDYETIRANAHAMAGISGSIGAMRLKQISSDIEKEIKCGNTKAANELVNKVFPVFEQFASLINTL